MRVTLPALRSPLLGRLQPKTFYDLVIQIAVALAGFSAGEADELRRAIGAWRSNGSIEKIGKKLRHGLLASGLPSAWVDRIFQQIKGFAEYGFPESHAASFALLAYASAYLKCHFPAEFTCALLNSQPMGFYASHSLVDDAKRHGVLVLPIHPNESDLYTQAVDNSVDKTVTATKALQLGWHFVKGLSSKDAATIVQERTKSRYKSLPDFCSRVRLPPQVLHRLAMGGAFSCFGLDERHALWEALACQLLLEPIAECAECNDPANCNSAVQLSLFSGTDLVTNHHTSLFRPLDELEAAACVPPHTVSIAKS